MDLADWTSSIENDDGKSMGPHAVMVTVPMLGHIYPLLQFAKALVAHHNFTVTFVNNHYYHHYLLSKEPPSTNSHGKLRFEWVENGLPSDFNFIDIWQRPEEVKQSCIDMQAPLKALMQSLNKKSPPVSCVIFGSFFYWAQRTAAELDIPSVFFWSQSAAVFSIYYHMDLLQSNGFFPYKRSHPATEFKEEDAHLVSYIPGVPPLHPADVPTFLHVEDTSHILFKMMEDQFDALKQCKTVVINSFHELEREPCDALQAEPISVFVVGPLLLSVQARNSRSDVTNNCTVENSQGELEGDECLRWLDKQSKHSVLYISFGTLMNPTAENIQTIALGLKESKQPFVWVIRSTSFHNPASGVSKSFMSVAETLPENFLEDTKDFGLIVPWAPQKQVLGHISTGAFLTHCGWNSTLESVSMGVPMIALAMQSDQTTNCKYVADIWKVGIRLQCEENGQVDGAEVMRVLRVLFQEEEGRELRRRAAKLRDAAWRAVETSSGSSSADMHNFSQAMRCPHIH